MWTHGPYPRWYVFHDDVPVTRDNALFRYFRKKDAFDVGKRIATVCDKCTAIAVQRKKHAKLKTICWIFPAG